MGTYLYKILPLFVSLVGLLIFMVIAGWIFAFTGRRRPGMGSIWRKIIPGNMVLG